ncbi:MAG: hypothetical protein ACI8ZB_002988 [Desulforhopalus sp.]|jgi:hypothetical protein
MYSAQRTYFHLNSIPFRHVFQKISYFIIDILDTLHKGIEAAKIAEKDPTDREAILSVLFDD